MTDVPATTDEQLPAEVDEPVRLPMLWTPNAMPLVIANADIDLAEQLAHQFPDQTVLYVLAQKKDGIHSKARLYKYVANDAGYAVMEAGDADLGLVEVKPEAAFRLPPIPWELVEKMDAFFRAIDTKYGTEAIVLLTFDPQYGTKDSRGWGVLVPEQTNTAGNCHYDPVSVHDDKPDNVSIVGSAHSHPGMSAFASHTDHHDQSNFDGLHITFGWGVRKPTEHHVELQMGGNTWKMEPKQVFTECPEPPTFAELDDWTDKVKKQTYQNNNWSAGHSTGSSSSPPTKKVEPPKFKELTRRFEEWELKKLPATCPNPNEYTIVTTVYDEEDSCPICERKFEKFTIENRRCEYCWNFLAKDGESVQQVISKRRAANFHGQDVSDLDWLDFGETMVKGVAFWHREKPANENGSWHFDTEVLFDLSEAKKKELQDQRDKEDQALMAGAYEGGGDEGLPFGYL